MPGQVERQIFFNSTQVCNLFEIAIRFLIGKYRKHSPLIERWMVTVLLNNFKRLRKERYLKGLVGFMSFKGNPFPTVNAMYNVFFPQVQDINMGKPRVAAKHKNIPYDT
jgi:hypothetical protein